MNCKSVLIAASMLATGILQVNGDVDHTTFAGYSKPTGGGSKSAVTVTSASSLISEAKKSGANVIKIKGKIDGAIILCSSDKTFIGEGTDATLTNSSFVMKDGVKNIIIRNLTMHLPRMGSKEIEKITDKDLIHIQDNVSNVWVDHCEFFNKYDGVKKDDYDGMLDITHGCTNITLSWCYIHDAWKTSLIGASSSDTHDWQVCYHHNLFNYVNSRLPSIRGGTGVFFNNYYLNIMESGINCREGTKVYIEKNYYEGVGSGEKDDKSKMEQGPIGWYYDSSNKGTWNTVDNIYKNCKGNQPTESTPDYKPSFMNNLSVLIPVKDVPAATKEFAGIIGKKKTLKMPQETGNIDSKETGSKFITNQNAKIATYNIRGEKIGNIVAAKNIANGVYISQYKNISVVKLNTVY